MKKHGRPMPYVIGTLTGGVPRLVNGKAKNAAPIVRALAAIRIDSRTRKVLKLEARPDAGCKASMASRDIALSLIHI